MTFCKCYIEAILTISMTDMFGLSRLCLEVGKSKGHSFNSLSLNLSLSVWPLLLDSLSFLLVKSFHISRFDYSLISSNWLSIVTWLLNGLIFVNFSSTLLNDAGKLVACSSYSCQSINSLKSEKSIALLQLKPI